MASKIETLTDPEYVKDVRSLSLDEVRKRRAECQDAEEALSLRRRLLQGRLDIVQAEIYRRAGGGSEADVSQLIEALPNILVDHGDRHLGPGRLTSLDTDITPLGEDFEQFANELDRVVDGDRLSKLANEDDATLRSIADELDRLERSISQNRHQLHRHIDQFQEEIVRRYKSGEASVDSLLQDGGGS